MNVLLLLKIVILAGLVSSCNSLQSQPLPVSPPRIAEVLMTYSENRKMYESESVFRDSLALWQSEGGRSWWLSPEADDNSLCAEDTPCGSYSQIAGQVAPGDIIIFREGVYRESLELKSGGEEGRPLRLRAYPGEMVMVSGSEPMAEGWTQEKGVWRHNWTQSLYMHRSKQRPQQAFRPEMLVYEGNPLMTVYEKEAIMVNHFWVEGEPEDPIAIHAIFPGLDQTDPTKIEVGRRAHLLRAASNADVNHVHVKGIAFVYSVISGKDGCVQTSGNSWLLEDNLIASCNGLGIMVKGANHVLRRNWAIANGQMGWATETSESLLEDNRSEWNNWKGYDANWEAGGGKFKHTSNTVIRRHFAANNYGPGIWLDIENKDNTVEDALVVNNQKAGIMLEYKTTGTVVRNNVVYGTRILGNAGSGIQIQAASNNLIENNTIYSNHGDGIRNKHHDNRAESGGNTIQFNVVLNNGLGHTNAQEIRVEGDLEAAQSDTYRGNIFGAQFAGNEIFMFGSYTGNKLDTWLRLSKSEGGQIVSPANFLEDVNSPDGWKIQSGSASNGIGKLTPGL